MTNQLYHCTACKYTGPRHGFFGCGYRGQDMSCPSGCSDENGLIPMLEYDFGDDIVPNAGETEHDEVLAAFHKYLKSEFASEMFDLMTSIVRDQANLDYPQSAYEEEAA